MLKNCGKRVGNLLQLSTLEKENDSIAEPTCDRRTIRSDDRPHRPNATRV